MTGRRWRTWWTNLSKRLDWLVDQQKMPLEDSAELANSSERRVI